MKLTHDLQCPNCGKTMKMRLENIHPGRKVSCPGCKSTINFQGDDMRKAQRSFDNFERNLKKMFK